MFVKVIRRGGVSLAMDEAEEAVMDVPAVVELGGGVRDRVPGLGEVVPKVARVGGRFAAVCGEIERSAGPIEARAGRLRHLHDGRVEVRPRRPQRPMRPRVVRIQRRRDLVRPRVVRLRRPHLASRFAEPV